MVKIVCDRCGRETYMKNPDLTGRAKIGFEEYDLCKYCILDIKRFINQGKADRKTEPQTDYKMPYEDCEDCETHLKAQMQARKTEPQYDVDKGTIRCDNCSENGSYKCTKCDGEMYFKRLEDEPQTDGYMTAEQAEDYRKMLDKAEHKVYGNIEDEPQTEYRRVGQAIDSVTGKVLGETYDVPQTMYYPQVDGITPSVIGKTEPQTDCSWQNDEHIPTELASTMLKNRFKEQNDG